MRRTGLRILGTAPWGRHFALFYETKDDLLEIGVPYLAAGLESNEYCIWVIADPLTEHEATSALRQAIPDLDRHLADRHLEIFHSKTWYFTGDTPDLQKVARGWETRLAEALTRGYDGMRVVAIVPGLDAKEWEGFLDYESTLDAWVADKAMLLLCAYPLARRRAADILRVARTHPAAVVKRDGEWEAR
jgi:hypothetical protein